MRRILYTFLLLILFVPVWPVAAEAATRYVDPTCSNGITAYVPSTRACTGGTDTSFTTVANGLAQTAPGDTLYIRTGTYAQNIDPRPHAPGTVNARITVSGFPGDAKPVFGPVSGAFPVFLDNRSDSTGPKSAYITLKDLVFDGTGASNGAGFTVHSITGVILDGLEIKNWKYNGILTGDTTDLVIRNCLIHDQISVTGEAGTRWYGIYFASGTNALIEDNDIYSNPGGGMQAYPGPINGLTIRGNRFRNNNTITNPGTSTVGGLAVVANFVPFTVNIYNNLFYANNTAGAGTSTGLGVSGDTNDPAASKVINIWNNVAYGNKNFGINIQAVPLTVSLRNNIAFGNLQGQLTFPGTVTASNNLTTDPSFVNAAAGDFHLLSGSSAINAGINVGLPFNGAAPEIGRYETFGCTTAAASGNVVDVTCQMNLNVPIQPATGQTTWVVKFNGTPRGTVSAGKLTPTDTTVRIQYDGGACTGVSDNITVDFTSGNVTDLVEQKLFSFTGLAVDESGCSGTPPSPPTGPEIVYHLNDASIGACCADSSGNGNTGTVTGSPALVTGVLDGAIDFADLSVDYISVPWGSGINPTTQSVTVCILVSPDSTSTQRYFFGTPYGNGSQRFFLGTINSTWSMGIHTNVIAQNNDFPVQAGYSLPCIALDKDTPGSGTGTATLWLNATKGVSSQSVKTYTTYSFAGNLTVGEASGFGAGLSPGGVIDEVFVFEKVLTQQEHTDLYQSLINPSPPGSGNRKQNGHQFQRPFKKADAPEDLRGSNGEAKVIRGGDVDVIFQIDCTGADCSDFGPRLHRSIDGGATYAQINDTCGVICFRGSANNPDLVTETVDECLSGALTDVSGPTNVTSAAVPNVALSEDHCMAIRYKLRTGYSEATPGQEIYLKLFDQNGNEFEEAYVPSLGAKLTIKEVGNGGGF